MRRRKDGFIGEQSIVLSPVVVEKEEGDELVSSLFVTDIGYYPNATNHYMERKTPIDQYVLIYCVDGRGWYGLRGKRHEVCKNEFFILPAGIPHEYGAADEWTIYWVHFRGEHASVYAEGLQTPHKIGVTMNSRIRDRISIFEEIFHTLYHGNGIEELRYASSLLHHFLATMRYLTLYRQSLPEQTDIVEAAKHFMHENVENSIGLEAVAKYVGYSPSHFSAVFKKATGTSPLAYFNQLKIDYACQLLRETTLKVNQISYKVGIEDPLYFSRLFSKVKGMSPSRYREACNVSVDDFE